MSSTVSDAERAARVHPAPPPRCAALAVRLWQLLPALAFVLFVLVQLGLLRGDAAGVYTTAASLAERGTFAIDGYIAALAPTAPTAAAPPNAYPQVAYAAGHYYHAVPPGRALLAAPAYALGGLLAPFLGPEAPAYCLLLLAALLGAFVVGGCCRAIAGAFAPTKPGPWLGALAVFALILPWVGGLTVPLALAALALAAVPGARTLLRGAGGVRAAFWVGLLLGAAILVDYLAGIIFGLGLLALALLLGLRLRRGIPALLLLSGGAVGPLCLAGWQLTAFGVPWRLAFRAAVDPAGRSFPALLRFDTLAALVLAVALAGMVVASADRAERGAWHRLVGLGTIVAAVIALVLGWLGYAVRARDLVLPLSWLRLSPLVVVLIVVSALVAFPLLRPRFGRVLRPGLLPTGLLIGVVLLPAFFIPTARAATTIAPGESYVAPFAIETNGAVRPLWAIERGQGQIAPDSLRLESGAVAISPWIDVWPGSAYSLHLTGDRSVQVTLGWESIAREPIVVQAATIAPGDRRGVSFAAPPGAAGLRLRLTASAGATAVRDLRLDLVAGVRVEPFPDRRRAALAFSFDWESAMGGLIHSRSSGEGEGRGATVDLRDDGGPSVAEAEVKGRRMRDGAQFLAGLFARYEIRATFYATGYNLIDGNPTCQKFLGDPIYTNADTAHGWGSDWWRFHPWYGDDPCSTEAQAPAWYFASETRELAAAGHEIASHSFGHLYVRGVRPEQLAADLELWNRSATALGLPPARSFAFPWTSSNSLDDRFWSIFARLGMTTLTRLYQTQAQPLPHPYELDRIAGEPALLVFPDYYLASHAEAGREALARIDTTLAVRGYHSLWDHPNEALEQDGPAIWTRVVAYAAAQRDRGLWIAPVTEIATYGAATRQVAVTALPVAGGIHLTIENRDDRDLSGLTLRTTEASAPTLPTFAPGAVATIVAR